MKDKSYIKLDNCSVEIPIFHADHLSLRSAITKINKKTVYVNCIDNINLHIKSGDIVGLYGPNGSGKTTLLRTISGAYSPTSGKIAIQGSINNLIETNIGIDPESSGYENIEVKLNFLNCPPEKISEKRKSIIEFSELGDYIYNPVKTYSTGMVMRLSFSIVTAIESEILLLDEWLSVGDAEFALKAEAKMKEITSEADVIIIASHNMEMLRNLCTKIAHLDSGKIKLIEKI